MTGTVPAASHSYIQAGTALITTDVAGNATLVFPEEFPNALVAISFTDGDQIATAGGVRLFGAFGGSANTSRSQVRFAVRLDTGVAVTNANLTVSYIAIGC